MARRIVDCAASDWQAALNRELRECGGADLTNFDLTLHGDVCVGLAYENGLQFRLSEDPERKAASLRDPWR